MFLLFGDENKVWGNRSWRPASHAGVGFLENPGSWLSDSADPDILEWAALHNRILVTADKSTMRVHAAEWILRGRNAWRLDSSPPWDDRTVDRGNPPHGSMQRPEEWNNVIIHIPLS